MIPSWLYSFQYIPNLCKIPETTAQKVISANMTYKRVPTLSECQTSTNTCFRIQCTWLISLYYFIKNSLRKLKKYNDIEI